jgi:hypothetical protein
MVRAAYCTAQAEEPPYDPTNELYDRFKECLAQREEKRKFGRRSLKRSGWEISPATEGAQGTPANVHINPSSRKTSPTAPAGVRSRSNHATADFPEDALVPLRLRRPIAPRQGQWYDSHPFTYEPMKLPTQLVTRVERTVVGGQEFEVEVQVEVVPQPLFLFPCARPRRVPCFCHLRPLCRQNSAKNEGYGHAVCSVYSNGIL